MSNFVNLKLSVTKQVVTSKEQGRYITDFEVKEYINLADPTTQATLKDLFRHHTYSSFIWEENRPNKEKCKECTAIIFDSDDGVLSMEQARQVFSPYTHIITTSTHHQENDDRHHGVQDRFRVILPLHIDDIKMMDSGEKIYKVIASLLNDPAYEFSDKTCKDLGRKYFPDTHVNDDHHKIYFNTPVGASEDPVYFRIDFQAAAKYAEENGIVNEYTDTSDAEGNTASGKNKQKRATPHALVATTVSKDQMFSMDDYVVLKDRKTKIKVRDIKRKTECFCLFCDDLASANASAFIDFNLATGFPHMYCSHCTKMYQSDPCTWLENILPFDNRFYQVTELVNDYKMALVDITSLLNVYPEEAKKIYKHAMAKNTMPSSKLVEEHVYNGYTEKTWWEMDRGTTTFRVHYKPIDVDIQDNEYIERFLRQTFPHYVTFIKKWLAWYCYSNFIPLPVLAFNGDRGTGKNTFFEMIGSWFPNSLKDWDGAANSNFNEWQDAKLVVFDEAKFDKAEQYDYIKKLTGGKALHINPKYGMKYSLRNNMKFIITTNKDYPVYITPKDFQDNPRQNQFFVYSFNPLDPANIDTDISNKLRARSGHYIRTVLRDIYEESIKDPTYKQNRYSIETPITPFMRKVVDSCRSEYDYEVLELRLLLKEGKSLQDVYGNPKGELQPVKGDTITFMELKKFVTALHTKSRPVKSFINSLVSAEILIPQNDGITYTIIKEKL